MQQKARKLYVLITLLLISGYGWLFFNFNTGQANSNFTACPVKKITTLPCPSCGTTRSMLFILEGNFTNSILTNPFGIITFTGLLVLPFWLLLDVVRGNHSFYVFFLEAERVLQKKLWAIIGILIVLANWIWNIYKGL